MIIQEKHQKEILGEEIAKNVKRKINKIVYWVFGVLILGTLSGMYLFSRGFIRSWQQEKIRNVNQFS